MRLFLLRVAKAEVVGFEGSAIMDANSIEFQKERVSLALN